MKNKFTKGFTLIELLVVIAIIGILSSVVLASLNTARQKGSDAAIKADLSGVRASAEVYYDSNSGRYNSDGTTATAGTDCGATFTANTIWANSNISAALAHARSQNGGTALYCNLTGNGSAYAIVAPLKTASTYWCIDSSGASKGTVGTGATAYATVASALTDSSDVVCN